MRSLRRSVLALLLSCVMTVPAYAGGFFSGDIVGGVGGIGDVVGPSVSVDNGIVRYDGTTGKLVQSYTSGTPTCGDTGICTFLADITISSTAPSLIFTDTTASAKSLTIAINDNLAQLRESAGASGSLLVLDLANGNVGIGTTSPTYPLSVAGTTNILGLGNAGQVMTFTSGGALFGINDKDSVQRISYTYGTQTLELNAANLSITASNALSLAAPIKITQTVLNLDGLTIYNSGGAAGTAHTANILFNLFDTVAGAEDTFGQIRVSKDAGGSNDDGFMSFYTNLDNALTERLRIASSGKVGIGTTSPLLKLDVAGSGRFTGMATSVLTGSIDAIASTTVTGVGTLFTTELVVGDRITITGETRTVTAIASDTSLTVDTATTDTANDTSPDKLNAIFITRLSSGAIGMVQNDLGAVGILGHPGSYAFKVVGTSSFSSSMEVPQIGLGGWMSIWSGSAAGVGLGSGGVFGWDSTTTHAAYSVTGLDTNLSRNAAGVVQVGTGTTPNALGSLALKEVRLVGVNGQSLVQGYKTELTTIAAAATTTTTITIPANAILKAVMMRVTVAPPGTATMVVTATTSATILQTGASMATTINTTDTGIRAWGTNYNGVAAQTITITPNATPSDATGRVRFDIYYEEPTVATS